MKMYCQTSFGSKQTSSLEDSEVELHFLPCLLSATVSLVILCGIRDDCSDGSVVIVVFSSISDFRGFHKDVKFSERAFVKNVLVHFILCVLTKC